MLRAEGKERRTGADLMSDVRPNSLSFCPVLAEMVASRCTVDREGNRRLASGLSTVNNLVVLRHLCEAIRPAATL